MLNIIRLELKKMSIAAYMKGGLIATITIFSMIILVAYISKEEGSILFNDYHMAFLLIDALSRAVFIIFAATLISKLFINEFTDKTITILFMYPINRKKLMIAKLWIIAVFTFTFIILCNLTVSLLFYVINENLHIIDDTLDWSVALKYAQKGLINAILTTGMSLIPFYFGMKKHSTRTTILSSLIIVLIACQSYGNFSINDIIIIPIILTVLGLFLSYLAIKNIEEIDLVH